MSRDCDDALWVYAHTGAADTSSRESRCSGACPGRTDAPLPAPGEQVCYSLAPVLCRCSAARPGFVSLLLGWWSRVSSNLWVHYELRDVTLTRVKIRGSIGEISHVTNISIELVLVLYKSWGKNIELVLQHKPYSFQSCYYYLSLVFLIYFSLISCYMFLAGLNSHVIIIFFSAIILFSMGYP
jgi:hypothetical protein